MRSWRAAAGIAAAKKASKPTKKMRIAFRMARDAVMMRRRN
jgi:hypothetical protein